MTSTNSKAEFVTSENEHWYQSKKKPSVYYPSVTTIIGDSYPKGVGFQKYLANLSSYEESQDILNAAGKRGTNVHNGTERLERGEVLFRENYTLEEWQMLIGFVSWHNEWNPKAIAIEHGLVSDKYKVGGTIDRVYEINGYTYILDIKTSSAIHENYWLQTSVYDALWTEYSKKPVDRTAILRLAPKRKNGYEFVFHEREDIDNEFKVFKAVRTIWDHRNPDAKPKILEVPQELKL